MLHHNDILLILKIPSAAVGVIISLSVTCHTQAHEEWGVCVRVCVCARACVCVLSNHLMDLTLRIRINENTSGRNPKCVSSQAHGGSSCLPLPFAARPLISHPTLSHEALFKYFNLECPSLQPIYFIWWGALHTARPWEKHNKWVWNLRISTAASPASSPRHLLSPHLSCLKSVFYTHPMMEKKCFPLQWLAFSPLSYFLEKSSGQFFFYSCQLSGLHYSF